MSETGTETPFEPSEPQYDNVFLFGAGVSAAAGIPLLKPFLDKMWEYAVREKVGETVIQDKDAISRLRLANKIRKDLESYNSRANFNDRNLEDVLSLLSFEALGGGEAEDRYNCMVKAVAKTIELSCSLKYKEGSPTVLERHQSIYHDFWRLLLSKDWLGPLPAIITFNYDLVLERALWDCFHYQVNDSSKPEPISLRLQYHYGDIQFALRVQQWEFAIKDQPLTKAAGLRARFIYEAMEKTQMEIPYFKLHGSLNWPPNKATGHPSNEPTKALDSPLILPPVFNKMNTKAVNSVWNNALKVLRNAKHIIVVGYSLPQTDIYMQYFLKAAVGPNSNLQKIIVFNPTLFESQEGAHEMEKRYRDCFSSNLSSYIEFRPPHIAFQTNLNMLARSEHEFGTFRHFVTSLGNERNYSWRHEPLLFYP